MTIPRMRTIRECIEMIKKDDEETALSEYFIRLLCKTEKVKYFKTGKKILVDFDNLLFYLQNNALFT